MKTGAKRLAAILMAAVMMTAMAVPAFAADDSTTPADPKKNDNGITTMEFDKILDADKDTYHPAETFNFTISTANAVAGEKAGEPETPVKNGVNGGAVFNSENDSKVTTDTNKTDKQAYSGLKITFDANQFPDPGIYKYTVTETVPSPKNKDIGYAAAKTLYVYVKADANGNNVVYAASLGDASGETKSADFTNTYKNNGGTPTGEEFKDLIIKKTVTGTMGEKNREFKFSVKVSSSSGRDYYVGYKKDKDNHETKVQLSDNTPYTTLTLKDGETFTIKNLAAEDTYEIVETDANKDGYDTTYKIDNVATGNDGKTAPAGTMATADVNVDVTNERNAVNPTGIIMSYGPYIAMIAAAAVLGFVFLRKREEI